MERAIALQQGVATAREKESSRASVAAASELQPDVMRKGSKQFTAAPAVTTNSARRGKTMAWFMSEELLEKTGSPSPPVDKQTPTTKDKENGGRKRGGRRARKLTESLSTASDASLPADDEERKETPTQVREGEGGGTVTGRVVGWHGLLRL